METTVRVWGSSPWASVAHTKEALVVILAIVGSVDLTQIQRVTAKIVIRGIIRTYEDPQVISGGAYGIDQLAEGVALDEGCWKRKYEPRFRRWEPEGFKERNMIIAQECDVLWSIRSMQSTTYGSGWTADYAEMELGKTVHRIRV